MSSPFQIGTMVVALLALAIGSWFGVGLAFVEQDCRNSISVLESQIDALNEEILRR